MKENSVRDQQENPLAQYSVSQLLRLLTQLSCTTHVERELHRRFGGCTVTIPVRLLTKLTEVLTDTAATVAGRHYF